MIIPCSYSSSEFTNLLLGASAYQSEVVRNPSPIMMESRILLTYSSFRTHPIYSPEKCDAKVEDKFLVSLFNRNSFTQKYTKHYQAEKKNFFPSFLAISAIIYALAYRSSILLNFIYFSRMFVRGKEENKHKRGGSWGKGVYVA